MIYQNNFPQSLTALCNVLLLKLSEHKNKCMKEIEFQNFLCFKFGTNINKVEKQKKKRTQNTI